VRERVEEMIGQSGPLTGPPEFTPRAKKVLELSLREAVQLGHNFIGTEHLLLALVREGEGVAAQVLVGLGADQSRVRQQVVELLAGKGLPRDKVRAETSRPRPQVSGLATEGLRRPPMALGEVCSLCGRDLWEVEHYVTAGMVRICEQCVNMAGEVIKAAQQQGRGPALRLPPRVFGDAPDGHAVDEIVLAFERAFGQTASDPELARGLEDCWVERIGFTGSDRARVRFGIRLNSGVTFPVEGAAERGGGNWTVTTETKTKVLRRLGLDLLEEGGDLLFGFLFAPAELAPEETRNRWSGLGRRAAIEDQRPHAPGQYIAQRPGHLVAGGVDDLGVQIRQIW